MEFIRRNITIPLLLCLGLFRRFQIIAGVCTFLRARFMWMSAIFLWISFGAIPAIIILLSNEVILFWVINLEKVDNLFPKPEDWDESKKTSSGDIQWADHTAEIVSKRIISKL